MNVSYGPLGWERKVKKCWLEKRLNTVVAMATLYCWEREHQNDNLVENGTGLSSVAEKKLGTNAGSFVSFAYCGSQNSKVALEIPDLVSMACIIQSP